MDEATLERIRADPAFHELVRKRAKLSWVLTAAIMTIYFGYFFRGRLRAQAFSAADL